MVRRAVPVLSVLLVAACQEEAKGSFGPPDAPRPVVLTAPARAPARAPAIDAGVTAPAIDAGVPAPDPEAALWRTPTTREEVRAIFAVWRHDPFCGTGDPWVSFSHREHAPELLTLLSDWAVETTANDRGIALAALANQHAQSLTPTWRLLAEEPGAPFALDVVWGLLRCGGDDEVPAALRVLDKVDDQELVFLAKHSAPSLSAAKLSSHLSLMMRLRPGRSFNRRESFLPAKETWSELVRAEPAFVACAARLATEARDPDVQLRLIVNEHGKVMSVETTVWEEGGAQRNRCVERVAQKLKFLPATASAFPSEPAHSELVLRVTPYGIK